MVADRHNRFTGDVRGKVASPPGVARRARGARMTATVTATAAANSYQQGPAAAHPTMWCCMPSLITGHLSGATDRTTASCWPKVTKTVEPDRMEYRIFEYVYLTS